MDEESRDGGPTAGRSIEDLGEAEIRRTVEEAVRRGRMTDPETRKPSGMLRAPELLVDDAPRGRRAVRTHRPSCRNACAPAYAAGRAVRGGSWNLARRRWSFHEIRSVGFRVARVATTLRTAINART